MSKMIYSYDDFELAKKEFKRFQGQLNYWRKMVLCEVKEIYVNPEGVK